MDDECGGRPNVSRRLSIKNAQVLREKDAKYAGNIFFSFYIIGLCIRKCPERRLGAHQRHC